MRLFIKFLVYRMKTLDGKKNSAVPILDMLNKNSVNEFLKSSNRVILSDSRETQFKNSNEYRIFKKVILKYTILTVRAKISYMAIL